MPDFTADDLYGGYTPTDTPTADSERYVAPVVAGEGATTDTNGAPSATTADPAGALGALYAQDPHATNNPLNAPGSAAAAANATGAVSNGTGVLTPQGTSNEPMGVFTKLLQGMKIADANGNVNISDPTSLQAILKSVGVLGNIFTTLQGPQNKQSASQLQAQFKSPFDTWNPVQQSAADKYFSNPNVGHALTPANANPRSIVPSTQHYAEGGVVENPLHVTQGALGLIHGQGGGQDDVVHALTAPGEYVWDADTVANLGDGNNAHGAEVLDKFREEVRAHKRSAPVDSIPPRAKAPSAYLAAAQRKGAK